MDVLNLYPGEDVIHHRWLEEGELTKLPEVPRPEDTEDPAVTSWVEVTDFEIPILPEDPEVVARREEVHKWNQAELLMMDARTEEEMPEATAKRKREKVAQGRRKLWREDNIRVD